MGMFLNYENISNSYVPNNLICSFPTGKSYTKLDPVQASKPYEEYDVKGNLIGYYWYQGESINLEFNIDGEITVESDALILTTPLSTPYDTVGKLYQRAYNITDKKSWTCTSVIDDVCLWTEDIEFTYPDIGTSVYVSAQDYMKNKFIDFVIYNFRLEPVYTQTVAGSTKVIFALDKEQSKKFVKGIYYCSLNVYDDKINLPVFTSKDCTLLVK